MSSYYFNTPMPYRDMVRMLDDFKDYLSYPFKGFNQDLKEDPYYSSLIYYYETLLEIFHLEIEEGRDWKNWLNSYQPDLSDRFIHVFPVTAKILDASMEKNVKTNMLSETIVKPITK